VAVECSVFVDIVRTRCTVNNVCPSNRLSQSELNRVSSFRFGHSPQRRPEIQVA